MTDVTNAAKAPLKVAVTGAAGQIAYSLLFRIASGAMLALTSRSPCSCWKSLMPLAPSAASRWSLTTALSLSSRA